MTFDKTREALRSNARIARGKNIVLNFTGLSCPDLVLPLFVNLESKNKSTSISGTTLVVLPLGLFCKTRVILFSPKIPRKNQTLSIKRVPLGLPSEGSW